MYAYQNPSRSNLRLPTLSYPHRIINPHLSIETQTLDERQELEVSIDLMRSSGISPSDYRNLLELYLDFYESAERILSEELSADIKAKLNFSDRLKSGWLKRDLHVLGSDKTKFNNVLLNGFQESSTPKLLGLIYVMEEATLHGQVISKHLEKTLHYSPSATRFFRSYESDVAARWKVLETVIQDVIKSPNSLAECCDGAKFALKSLRRTLSSWSGFRKFHHMA